MWIGSLFNLKKNSRMNGAPVEVLVQITRSEIASRNRRHVALTLQAKDWRKVFLSATLYADRISRNHDEGTLEASDYAAEAITRFLDGKRKWYDPIGDLPVDVLREAFSRFILGVVKSLVSNEQTSPEGRFPHVRYDWESFETLESAHKDPDSNMYNDYLERELRRRSRNGSTDGQVFRVIVEEMLTLKCEDILAGLQALDAERYAGWTEEDVRLTIERIRYHIRKIDAEELRMSHVLFRLALDTDDVPSEAGSLSAPDLLSTPLPSFLSYEEFLDLPDRDVRFVLVQSGYNLEKLDQRLSAILQRLKVD